MGQGWMGETRAPSTVRCELPGDCQMEFSLGKHGKSSEENMDFLLELFELPYGWEQTFAVALGFIKPWLVAALDTLSGMEERVRKRPPVGIMQEGSAHTHHTQFHGVTACDPSVPHFISFLSLGPFVVLVFEEESLLPRQLRMGGKVKSPEEVFALSHLGPLPHLTDGGKACLPA